MMLSASDRSEIQRAAASHRAAIAANFTAEKSADAGASLGSIIGEMFLAYPLYGASKEQSRALTKRYIQALSDVPVWAIGEAVRRWGRGECGEKQDYKNIPDSAALRSISLRIVDQIEGRAGVLERLLLAREQPDEPPEPSEEERAAMRTRFDALLSSLTEAAKIKDPPLPRQVDAATRREEILAASKVARQQATPAQSEAESA